MQFSLTAEEPEMKEWLCKIEIHILIQINNLSKLFVETSVVNESWTGSIGHITWGQWSGYESLGCTIVQVLPPTTFGATGYWKSY